MVVAGFAAASEPGPDGKIVPTAVVDKETGEPRSEKTPAEVGRGYLGLPTRHYPIAELMESYSKSRDTGISSVFDNMLVADPEFRRLAQEAVDEKRGETYGSYLLYKTNSAWNQYDAAILSGDQDAAAKAREAIINLRGEAHFEEHKDEKR